MPVLEEHGGETNLPFQGCCWGRVHPLVTGLSEELEQT